MYLMDPKHSTERRAVARNLAERTLESGGDVARNAMHNASHFMGDALHTAKDKFADAASNASDAVSNGKQKIMDSASDSASNISDTASAWMHAAKQYLPRSELEKHSDYAMNPAAVSATAASTLIIAAMWLFDPIRGRGASHWVGQKLTRFVNEVRTCAQLHRSTLAEQDERQISRNPLGGARHDRPRDRGGRRAEFGRLIVTHNAQRRATFDAGFASNVALRF